MEFDYDEWLKGVRPNSPKSCVKKIRELVSNENLDPPQILFGIHKLCDINMNEFFIMMKEHMADAKEKFKQNNSEFISLLSKETSVIKKGLYKRGIDFKEILKEGLTEEEYNIITKYDENLKKKEMNDLKFIADRRNVELPKVNQNKATNEIKPKKKIVVVRKKTT